MPRVPPVNAQVEWIGTPGGVDAYGDPEPSIVKWTGTAPAYLTEKVLVEPSGAGSVAAADVVRAVIPSNLGVTVEHDDEIRLTKNGETTTRRVKNIEERSDYGFVRLFFY